MQYFKDRSQAGQELAERLDRYKDSFSVVLAISPLGGVVVAKEIAAKLHLPMGMMAVKEVHLPWRQGPLVGSIDQSGEYTKNPDLTEGVLNAYEGEYHSHIDKERIRLSHEINMMHLSNSTKRENLKDHTVIIVSDGLNSVSAINEVIAYLKPVRTTRLVAALPIATIDVIDRLHLAVDEIHCIDVKDNYINTDHYYDNPEIPEYEELLKTLISFDTMA